jgi:hypothetical protein
VSLPAVVREARPLRHTRALWRCLWRGIPVAHHANARCRELTAAFEASVTPMIAAVVEPPDRRYLHDQLLSWGIKSGYMVENFARVAGCPPQPEASILGGVFTRLYDDALDETDDETAGERLTALFDGGDLAPHGTVERLVDAVYRRLRELAPASTHRTAYRALAELHRCQLVSLKQAGPELSAADVWELALAKGGAGVVVLCSLVHPGMSPAEETIIHDLGGFLQLVDDYQDAPDDRRAGLRTTATDGTLTRSYLLTCLRDIEDRIIEAYGREMSRDFVDSLYLWLYTVLTVRLLRSGPVRRRRGHPVPRRLPMRVILTRREVFR